MFDFLSAFTGDQVVQIVLFVAALIVIWIVLRFVLRLAVRVFSIGCGLLLALGVLLLVLKALGF
jgi:hypothetical protein